MKRLFLISGLIILLTNCQPVEPSEQAATVISMDMPPPTALCTCCFGYRIQIGTNDYYATTIPFNFAQANTPVWIRYKADTEHCPKTPGRITIISIRSR